MSSRMRFQEAGAVTDWIDELVDAQMAARPVDVELVCERCKTRCAGGIGLPQICDCGGVMVKAT